MEVHWRRRQEGRGETGHFGVSASRADQCSDSSTNTWKHVLVIYYYKHAHCTSFVSILVDVSSALLQTSDSEEQQELTIKAPPEVGYLFSDSEGKPARYVRAYRSARENFVAWLSSLDVRASLFLSLPFTAGMSERVSLRLSFLYICCSSLRGAAVFSTYSRPVQLLFGDSVKAVDWEANCCTAVTGSPQCSTPGGRVRRAVSLSVVQCGMSERVSLRLSFLHIFFSSSLYYRVPLCSVLTLGQSSCHVVIWPRVTRWPARGGCVADLHWANFSLTLTSQTDLLFLIARSVRLPPFLSFAVLLFVSSSLPFFCSSSSSASFSFSSLLLFC